MARYRAILAYDGTAYLGYQVQAKGATIQGTIEQVLKTILGKPTTVWAAGRTDTGVHATGQVIAFDADWKHAPLTLLHAVNAHLPDDIALQTIVQHDDFHPRFDALSRTYRYQLALSDVRQPLLAKRAWQMRGLLDDRKMQEAATLLIGEHDFAAFGTPPRGENTVRAVFQSAWSSETQPLGQVFYYDVEATAFLYHMVRRMVGMQVAVGLGKISLADFTAIFHSHDLRRAKWMAPAHGLTLTQVRYPPIKT